MACPVPPSHRTFTFNGITIDSNFDSGNCSNAERVSETKFNIWIGTDSPKYNYRTWFYFSVDGFSRGSKVTFRVKNMQNQSRLLREGLVPVVRESSGQSWRRVIQTVSSNRIEYNEEGIEWEFCHTWLSEDKVFLAFFYPWSNEDNSDFLMRTQEKIKGVNDIYYYRNPIIRSLQQRPVELLVISSSKGRKLKKQEPIQDEHLFANVPRPSLFTDRKFVVVGARVHPGEVPASHVMTGVIAELTENSVIGQLLRQNFVFYIFPILNPDGVARGHYRVDTNGINLNRCYVNPSAKYQPSIYAVKKVVSHLHQRKKFYAFLDLHAHATKRGCFAYGNFARELMSQVNACLFPKILSMNSSDFEYQASNFTKSNMSCNNKADQTSKEGSGRVAIFKATKNAYCWTLQCNYNMSRVHNVLETQKKEEQQSMDPSEDQLNPSIILDNRTPCQKQASEFFTIETYRKLGKEICESFLDLIQTNPYSRIGNPDNSYKSVQNLKMNLAVALMRMEPGRFEDVFREIAMGLANRQNKLMFSRSLQALYYCTIQNVTINHIQSFIRDEGVSITQLLMPEKRSKSLPRPFDGKTKESTLFDRKFMKQTQQLTDSKQLIRPLLFPGSGSQRGDLGAQEESLRCSDIDSTNRSTNVNYTRHQLNNHLYNQSTIPNIKRACNRVCLRLDEFKLLGTAATSQKKSENWSKITNVKLRIQCLPSLSKSEQKGHSVRQSKRRVH